jgi:hypothetical protein
MSVAGPCEICLTGTVEHTCDRCGALVCERHFDETSGLCVDCAAESGGETPPTSPDSTDRYRF